MSTCTECFQALGCFDYNAANKISNKIIRINAIGSILVTITKCEQSYTSFEYLKTNKFFRKDDYLNTEVINLINILIKSTPPINPNHNEDHIDPDYLMRLCRDLKNFIKIRQEQISIYRAISTHFSNFNSDYIIDEIEAYKEKAENFKLVENLGPLGIGVERELTILRYLFIAQKAITAYDFKNSTIFLYNAKSYLSSWKEICSQQVYSEKSSKIEEPTSAFAFSALYNVFSDKLTKNGKRTNESPNNMQWIENFLCNLTSKMTLYFMNILLERENVIGGDIKSLWKDTTINYHKEIKDLLRQTGANHIALIYEVTEDIPFHEDGYGYGGTKYKTPEGKNSFPFIYSFPKEKPEQHQPNIISIIQNNKRLSPFTISAPSHFYDNKVGRDYYYIRIDDHVWLIIIFSEKHSIPNNALESIMSLSRRLSGVEILNSLQKFSE
ncbi:hypothetical protein Glove_116g37 [Diversispora epigaea]|uniref:Uncharacterized protein n=1 Tax=Diversispora epigaea TaxID=1348612 RepID=A0A397J4M4_9GLOM|nr:hypothetical protein Glove_116g37 [Diversispora epigaea]